MTLAKSTFNIHDDFNNDKLNIQLYERQFNNNVTEKENFS